LQVFSLSIHADYRCRHSGRCCQADWDVPVELPVYRSLVEAMEAGRLRMAPQSEPMEPFVTGPDLPEDTAAMFERNHQGECVFFERGSRLCVIHRDLGEDALAATCRHFPRLAVRDGRGAFIGLSHFCPTAASLLFREDVALTIVESPGAFPPAEYEGLTVEPDDVPPLLRPDVMMEPAAYTAWEQHMVRRAASNLNPESLLATLWRDAGLVRLWRPDGPSIVSRIHDLPAEPVRALAPATLAGSLEDFRAVMAAVPDDLRPAPDEHGLEDAYVRFVQAPWETWSHPLRNYVAAKAFACWTAYQGRGLRSIVRGLEAAVALVRVEAARQCRDAGRALDQDLLLEAFRQADFALNHLAVGEDLAEAWSVAETEQAGS
jgi:hypothetical protein